MSNFLPIIFYILSIMLLAISGYTRGRGTIVTSLLLLLAFQLLSRNVYHDTDIAIYDTIFCSAGLSNFYLKEFLLYAPAKAIYSSVQCSDIGFTIVDFVYIYILYIFAIIKFEKKYLFIFALFVVSYFFQIGFFNIYRQGVAELWLLFFILSPIKNKTLRTVGEFLPTFIHNFSLLPFLILKVSSLKFLFLIIFLALFILVISIIPEKFYETLMSKSVVSVGRDFTVAYVGVFAVLIVGGLIVGIEKRFLIALGSSLLVLAVLSIYVPGRVVERAGMYLLVVNLEVVHDICYKICGRRLTPIVLVVVFTLPIFAVGNVRNIVFG